MKKLEIVNSLSRTFHKAGLQLKKHSPEILTVVGVVGGVTSAVLACKATLKVNEVLEQPKKDIEKIHEAVEHKCTAAGVDYSEEDGKKDLAIVYTQTGLKLVKLYAPAVILGVASATCIFASSKIMHKRNVALTAAYMAEHTGFKEYRERVIDRFGKELDKELKYNIKAAEIEETVTNEDGTKQTVKKTVSTVDPNLYSPYAVVFDEANPGWDKDPSKTKYFLVQQQNYANDKLRAQGHLFLNDVYEMLGFRKVPMGQVVGWIYDEAHPNGDNYVDFGIFDIYNQKATDFVNGYEKNIILDFNVDGVVYELLK